MKGELELREIQGLVLSGYGERPVARYALLEIVEPGLARAWLGSLLKRVQFGDFRESSRHEPPFLADLVVNVAFTHAGLSKLGLPAAALSEFSPAFQEGMSDPNRARRLGDDGPSAPEKWAWGRSGEPLHVLLAVFGGKDDPEPEEDAALDAFLAAELGAGTGVRPLGVLGTTPVNRKLRKEHFGFRDGISNPRLAAFRSHGSGDYVANGEFVLGYENGYGKMPISPAVPPALDPRNVLPRSAERGSVKDFGKNGSYLVFRQLSQDVRAFWQYVHDAKAAVPDAPSGAPGSAWLGAKLVGRWPNGTPLTLFPDAPGPDDRGDENRFLCHAHGDSFGARCPIGSHIRRTNPRDTALPVPHDPELSGSADDPKKRAATLAFVNLHRILRRGRAYGSPVDPGYDPEVLRTAPPDGLERGLHFLCFNANIARQFEFVQSNWALNPAFAGLSSDPDPLLCAGREVPFPAGDFTIQGLPPRRVKDLPRVVETRGGAYFFMPSRSALRYLSGA